MRFYDRESELKELQRIQKLSFNDYSRMTIVTGRRRIGKTSLVLKSVEDSLSVYLFVGRKNEATLCAEFIPIITSSLNTFIPEGIQTFRSLFQYLMELATTRNFNLIIDEFQEFYNINESVFSDMQNIWDSYRKKTHMNLIISGSVYSLMNKIFQNSKEPLFGRADNIIKLSAFNTTTIKEIIKDHFPAYTNDDLLAFYSFTGGNPKYTELLCDSGSLDVNGMIEFMYVKIHHLSKREKICLLRNSGKITQRIFLY